jgi:polysaccharide pyruvyl transferase WcaK-like protein
MDTISIVDTSICTDNLGDEIIMDAVNRTVWSLFPNAYIFRVPSHEALSDRTRGFLRKSSWCFIGGTNLLSSTLGPWDLWRLDEKGAAALGSTRTICLAPGWRMYMDPPAGRAKALLQTALWADGLHSVRDSYTRDHLDGIGLAALATSCVTTWGLTPAHCQTLPKARSGSVVFTLTAWHADPAADRAFVEVLRSVYHKLYFFPQMQDDDAYFLKFGWEDIEVAATTLEAYDRFLENENVDFVGTRLHGGIRALQKGRRALILAIDNRATEIGKDTGLPVLARTQTDAIRTWLEADAAIRLELPQPAIDRWRAQFGAAAPMPTPITEPAQTETPIYYLKQAAKAALGRG